jgi:hypothetical protein
MIQLLNTGLKEYHAKPFYHIEFDEANKWIYSQWIYASDPQSFSAGIHTCVQLINSTKCTNLVIDISLLNYDTISANTIEWLKDTCLPILKSNNLQRIALIVASGVVDMYCYWFDCMEEGLESNLKVFGNGREAIKWLRS